MSLIPCTEDCVYANEGYCELNTASAVTNNISSKCVHKVAKKNQVTLALEEKNMDSHLSRPKGEESFI